MALPDLSGWVPMRVFWQQARPMVDWCYLGDRRFAEPFFQQTIDMCMSRPFNRLFRQQTPIEALGELHARSPGLAPSALIFHMSRCGSTLVAQLLASLPRSVVLSEAEPIDTVLRARASDPLVGDEQRVAWLRWLVGALGQPRRGDERHLFIKFDCWHTCDLPLIRRAFPDSPWVFVYRDPVEVLVSLQREPGAQVVPGMIDPALFGLSAEAAAALALDEYAARVLGSICAAAARQQQRDAGLLLSYRDLPEAVWLELLPRVGITPAPGELARMRHVSRFHSKRPSLFFEGDAQERQHAAGPALRLLAERWVGPAYAQLEALHAQGIGDGG